jgi:DNA-binding phage protein
MKSKNAKTGFDRYFTDRMKDREFAEAYTETRAAIDSVDAFVRSIDEVRSKAGVSKALLAKRTGTQPAAMRRLLTMDAPNPTLATVMSIVRSLGYRLALVPAQGRAKRGRARKGAAALAATA